jgi:hypothetical protein
VNRLNQTSSKGVGDFYSPPGECNVREGRSVQTRAYVAYAACGLARFDAVYVKEMMQPLDSVRVKFWEDA